MSGEHPPDDARKPARWKRLAFGPFDWVDDHLRRYAWAGTGAVGAAPLAGKTGVGAAEVPLIEPNINWTLPMTAVGIPAAALGAIGSARKADRAKDFKAQATEAEAAVAAAKDERVLLREAFEQAKEALRTLTDARLLLLGQELADTWRASLFLVSSDESEFILVGRASPNRHLCKPPKHPYPISAGLIGQAYAGGSGTMVRANDLPDPNDSQEYRKAHARYGLPKAQQVRSLSMMSREYCALAVGDAANRRVAGVLVLESLMTPAPGLERVVQGLSSHNAKLMSEFLEAHAKLPTNLEVRDGG